MADELVIDCSEPVLDEEGEVISLPADTFVQELARPPLAEAKAMLIESVLRMRGEHLAAGFAYDFGDARGVHHIGTTEGDLIGWDEVTQSTAAEILIGDFDAPITIVTDTGPAVVTALEWQHVLVAAKSFRQPIWAASFALQAAIAAASNHEQLDAINLETAWP